MFEGFLFIIFSYLSIGFGIVTLHNEGLDLNQTVKFSVMWLPLLLVYYAFLREK